MYEKELLQIGFIAGYFFAIMVMITVLYIFACLSNKRYRNYLLEIKQVQKFEEWEKQNTRRLKWVK